MKFSIPFAGMSFDLFRRKMEVAGLGMPAIRSFERNYQMLLEGGDGLIPEASIEAVTGLPVLEEIRSSIQANPELVSQTAILKLNGGLGTGMGLERAKSLLPVREGLTFLDLIARQVVHAREGHGATLRFFLLNSFSTSVDTLQWLGRHPELGEPGDMELLQNKVPKILVDSLQPATWPKQPSLEWCPPGHGDLYTVLASGDRLSDLLSQGIRYLFVSNSDNLGASLDLEILTWFADSGAPFLMEVTPRTASDRKGGHLARQKAGLLLRESAQCPLEDLDSFQDIGRHQFFNTNNLWLRLDRLQEALAEYGGFLPLPLIRNEKTVDPRDSDSPKVYQLETAMGAAISCFPDATAMVVSRGRFAPVKSTGDLLALRSDAYELTAEGRLQLISERNGLPPRIKLDGNYKIVDHLEAALEKGIPSLKDCSSLQIFGRVTFSPGVVLQDDVTLQGPDDGEWKLLHAGTYGPGEVVV